MVIATATSPAIAQINFELVPPDGVSSQAVAGFQVAANRWASHFSDPITVTLALDFRPMGSGILASTNAPLFTTNYASVRTQLTLDRTTADDFLATTHLPAGPSVSLYVNQTSDSPVAPSSPTPYLDNNHSFNNRNIYATRANFKALGYTLPAGIDATVSFNSAFTWDFDPTDGISRTAYDFVGIAMHEIGHALGFTSGVLALDISPSWVITQFPEDSVVPHVLDLYRYSSASAALQALDLTADARAKYFSLDRGLTQLALFSTGDYGDGRQAPHWRDDALMGDPLGVMDPSAWPGQLHGLSLLDLRAMDVIGYNLRAVPIPEPATYGVLAGLVLGTAILMRRQRSGRANV